MQNALSICREWPDGLHLEVEDVYRTPLFEASLKLMTTDYDSPSPDHIAKLLEYVVCVTFPSLTVLTSDTRGLCALGSSAAILVARYPDVVACLRLRASTQDVFVLFNPRVNSEDKQVASLTFSISLPQIARRLCDVFPLDKNHRAKANDWHANLLERCTGHVFVPRPASYDARAGEEALIVSSLTLLSLRAELEELTRDNGSLKRDKQRLQKNVVDLEVQLVDEKTKVERAQSSKPLVVNTTRGAPVGLPRGPRLAQPSRSTRERGYVSDGQDEIDPSMQFALQLQASFDSENEFLLKQKHELVQTAQRQYHCGVCMDDFPEDDAVHIDACGHEICRDCARGHICSKIEEHRFPVLCPVCMADRKNQNPGSESRG